MSIKTFLALLLTGGFVSAEVTQFRPGGLVVWLLSIFGFNVIDLSSAIPEFIYLFIVCGIGYLIYRAVKK